VERAEELVSGELVGDEVELLVVMASVVAVVVLTEDDEVCEDVWGTVELEDELDVDETETLTVGIDGGNLILGPALARRGTDWASLGLDNLIRGVGGDMA
jgi:hypothetical protein